MSRISYGATPPAPHVIVMFEHWTSGVVKLNACTAAGVDSNAASDSNEARCLLLLVKTIVITAM